MKKLQALAFAAAAMAVCSSSASRAQQAFTPSVGIDAFQMLQPESIPGSKNVSTNYTAIVTADFAVFEGVDFIGSVRTDWVNMDVGFFNSQYAGVKDLYVKFSPTSSFVMTLGTVPFWGPMSAQLSFDKWNTFTRGLGLGMGGPQAGLIGDYFSTKGTIGNFDYRWEGVVGTGDRFVQPQFAAEAGTYFPVLCGQTNSEACGLVAGTKFTVSPAQGLDFYAMGTVIGNGDGLRTEERGALGANWQKNIGNGLTFDAMFDTNKVGNYLGSAQGLQTTSEALSLTKNFNDAWSLEGYLSGTQVRDTLHQDYYLAGVDVTWHYNPRTTFVFSPYTGIIADKDAVGAWFAVDQKFDIPLGAPAPR